MCSIKYISRGKLCYIGYAYFNQFLCIQLNWNQCCSVTTGFGEVNAAVVFKNVDRLVVGGTLPC